MPAAGMVCRHNEYAERLDRAMEGLLIALLGVAVLDAGPQYAETLRAPMYFSPWIDTAATECAAKEDVPSLSAVLLAPMRISHFS